MKTNFENLSQLKNLITEGQQLFIENHFKPERSRITRVRNKQSYFFTVETEDNREAWIINGAVTLKNYGFSFEPERERVQIFFKANNAPFVTLHFNETIIKGKA
jgi:hypothetical protein